MTCVFVQEESEDGSEGLLSRDSLNAAPSKTNHPWNILRGNQRALIQHVGEESLLCWRLNKEKIKCAGESLEAFLITPNYYVEILRTNLMNLWREIFLSRVDRLLLLPAVFMLVLVGMLVIWSESVFWFDEELVLLPVLLIDGLGVVDVVKSGVLLGI